jgi:alpha-beta hydrolase superfamily lysophospholipase
VVIPAPARSGKSGRLGRAWSHRRLCACLILVFAFLLFNVVCYNHARAMTHFTEAGERTANPESLSRWQKLQILLRGVNVPRPKNDSSPGDLGLPYQTQTFLGDGEADLEAWHVPHPNPKGQVLLFHGYAASKASLLGEARAFREMGFATFLVDFRGSGGSGGNVTTVGMREADDVARAVHHVQARGGGLPLLLYGQSMGSAAILRAITVNGVQPGAAILECPFDRLLSTVANRFKAMGLPASPFAQALVFWGGLQHGFDGFAHNPVEYARGVNCPVLLMHGEEDPRVSPEQAEAIFQSLAGEKEFVLFAGTGHESYLAAQPEAWKREVRRFLARQAAPGVRTCW